MKIRTTAAGHNKESGLVITLVAVVLLFVVGAMAVLAIDVATFYTARSEAQLAADAAALAGARVLANSGTTSDPGLSTLSSAAKTLASAIATQVATQNEVGGSRLQQSNLTISFPTNSSQGYNPLITVKVTRDDLPTFFARIWGNKVASVTAVATAEAYNPSGTSSSLGTDPVPVAPTCVKPWVLPNKDPSNGGNPIFDAKNGTILSTSLLGYGYSGPLVAVACGNGVISCNPPSGVPVNSWQYFPGNSDPTDPNASFPAPSAALPACTAGFDYFQLSTAGCAQTPISCGGNNSSTNPSKVNLYVNYVPQPPNTSADAEAAAAANCLTHSNPVSGSGGDILLPNNYPVTAPLQFTAGTNNPVVPAGQNILVSDSLIVVPVAKTDTTWNLDANNNVQIIGFVHLFLNPTGARSTGPVSAAVTNLVGCGTDTTKEPIFGNGASAVAVRLIHQ